VFDPGRVKPGVRAVFSRWGDNAFRPSRTIDVRGATTVQVGFEVAYKVHLSFADLHGREVSPERVRAVTLSSTLGARDTFSAGRDRWMPGGRVARRAFGLEETHIQYSVESVIVDGASVVRRAQQRFLPAEKSRIRLRLLLYSARITARDVLFHRPTGSALVIKYPNGKERRFALPAEGIYLPALARGTYGLRAVASGMSPAVPLSVSKNQVLELRVVTLLDLVVMLGGGGAIMGLLVLLGRRRMHARSGRLSRSAPLASVVLVAAAALLVRPGAAHTAIDLPAARPTPALAYYYIWYDRSSWRRAKQDYPLLGRYSSDDISVMRRHVAWAKDAGLTGFIVSWKATPTLDRRLEKLVQVSHELGFKLVVIYQGLDFHRRPLPAARVRADLEAFASKWRGDPAFNLFGRPLVVWSGTWRFSRRDVLSVTEAVRPRLHVLASERSVAGYERLAGAVDGNAYYWSSVDPQKDAFFSEKLRAMGDAVHRHGGIWIPPAAPAFDARMIGGHRVVPRRGGETLRLELDAAQQSSPDAIGLISWNEFSENSFVEPSVGTGHTSLRTLRDLLRTGATGTGDFDSSDPPQQQIGYGLPLLTGVALVLAAGFGLFLWRRAVRPIDQGRPPGSLGNSIGERNGT
jgi:hypothetical protein